MEEKEMKKSNKAGKSRKFRLKYHRWLVKNIPYYFFAAVLVTLYIANGHYADKMVRKISTTEKQLKEMEYEFKIVKREVIFRSKESELVKAVTPLGLQELKTPPLVIRDTIKAR
ncbi:MAG: hypothetical protein J5I50_02270 [Chitinophagaceae bacterium]|nr:hypothetical protein [Chitinophagaceae bacterium]